MFCIKINIGHDSCKGRASIGRKISMILRRKRACKKVGMILLTLVLFLRQTMFLSAKELETEGKIEYTETKKTERIEERKNTELSGGVEQDENLFPFYSNMDELVEGIREKLATGEENFSVYVPYLLIKSTEFDGIQKQIFPVVRAGNYYSGTIYGFSISCFHQANAGEDMVRLDIEVKRTDTKKKQDVAIKRAGEIAARIEKNALNDYEKIKMAHDYLVKNIEYKIGYDGAYNALCLGRAVCNGYAAAFQLIMEELGIPCMMICSHEINHVWNCVYLEGDWYNIDVTWDDSTEKTGTIYYQYFLKAQKDFYGHGDISFSTAKKSYIQEKTLLVIKNGWKQTEGQSRYYMDGRLVIGWLYDSGNWYYFNKDGVMQTGWIKSAGEWYYLGEDGVMQTGWVKSAGKWYYLGEGGVMQTGWIKSNGKWYYLDNTGAMV